MPGALLLVGCLVSAAPAGDTEATRLLKARDLELREDVVKVADGVFVAVCYSPANISMIVGIDGLIIVDTGMAPAHARRVLAEFRKISDLPIKAIIYTHGHGDHTGGASVFVGDAHPDIWARSNFGSEGKAFSSVGLTIQNARGARQAGFRLPPEKRINNGVAPAMYPRQGGRVFTGESGRIAPTKTFSEARKAIELAGVKMELVAAPGETKDQLYVWLPEKKVLLSGDNFYRSWPNAYAIRGTPYRDVRAWAEAVDMMLKEGPEVLVPGHTRPIIGKARATQALTDYRDAIRFVFDKTIEGMNKGLTPDELVSYVKLPERFADKDYLREYYGNVEWAVRAIFQGYLGWFDGNPTNLFRLTPRDEAQRVARLAGGADVLLKRAREALAGGDAQWAAQLCDYLLVLNPQAAEPKRIKADALTALAEKLLTATGRNYYLTVAQELRAGADRAKAKATPAAGPTGNAKSREEANKKAAMEFFQLLMGDINYQAARKYAGQYIQHDPGIADGFDALAKALQTNPRWKDRKPSKVDFKLVAADGDLVYLQTHREVVRPDGTKLRIAVIHTFRFDEEGKIAEHWTIVGKADPTKTVSKHPLF